MGKQETMIKTVIFILPCICMCYFPKERFAPALIGWQPLRHVDFAAKYNLHTKFGTCFW